MMMIFIILADSRMFKQKSRFLNYYGFREAYENFNDIIYFSNLVYTNVFFTDNMPTNKNNGRWLFQLVFLFFYQQRGKTDANLRKNLNEDWTEISHNNSLYDITSD